LVFAAVEDVIRKHGILFAIPVNEDSPNAYFASLASINLEQSVHFLRRSRPFTEASSQEDKELDGILQDQHNTDFKAKYGALPFWRLIILETPEVDVEFTACFIYHHAIGDGVSGLVFHNAFRKALNAVASLASIHSQWESNVMPDKSTWVLPPVEEIHPLPICPSLPDPGSRKLREWTADTIRTPCRSRWMSFCISSSASRKFFQECKDQGLSVTPVLSSIIASVLFNILPPTEEVLTCIIPINLRPWLKLPGENISGAIGTYFDATRVQFTRPHEDSQGSGSRDIWPGAREVSNTMDDYLQNVSPSGEPYTAIAALKPVIDFSVICNAMLGQPRDAAFEVTNVGLLTPLASLEAEEASLWRVEKVLLSRSALASGAAITVSVATGGNGSMAVGLSWQDSIVQDDIVLRTSNGIQKHFERYK
jgi:hypothetical protein